MANLRKALFVAALAVMACLAALAGCGTPARSDPRPSLVPAGSGGVSAPAGATAPAPTVTRAPTITPLPTAAPTPLVLPDYEEWKQDFTAEIQPLVETLLSAKKDPGAAIQPEDEIIYIPQTDRLYAVQSALGFAHPLDPGTNRRVYVLYEVLRGGDLVWKQGDVFTQSALPNTQSVITTLRLVLETDGQYSLIERVDGSGGEGSVSFEELITKSVVPFESLPANLRSTVENDLEQIAAYACGIDLHPELDLTRRATALALTLESKEWADKDQGLAALSALPALPDSLIPILLAHLNDDIRDSSEIGELLSKMGASQNVFAQLAQDASNPDAEVRKKAAWLLGNASLEEQSAAIPLLVDLARDADDDVSDVAVNALVNIGAPAVEPLIEVLQDPDIEIRQRAAQGLGQLKDSRAIQPLVEAARAGDRYLCQSATLALGNIGGEAVEPLIAILRDQDPLVRAGAAEALGMIEDPRAVDPLISTLGDGDENVRHNSAVSLGEIADPRAVLPITTLLQDDDQWVRENAILVLEKFKDPRAVAALISTFKDKEWRVRSYASEALVTIGSPAVEPLIAALTDQNADARFWSAQTLSTLDDSRAVEPLLARLRLGDVEVIAGAYRFLIAVGETGSEPSLISALNARGTEEMAETFLNCQNTLLDQAAREWAKANHYKIKTDTSGEDFPIWGSKP